MKTIKLLVLLMIIIISIESTKGYYITPYQKEVLQYTEKQYRDYGDCDIETVVCKIVELNIWRMKKGYKSLY